MSDKTSEFFNNIKFIKNKSIQDDIMNIKNKNDNITEYLKNVKKIKSIDKLEKTEDESIDKTNIKFINTINIHQNNLESLKKQILLINNSNKSSVLLNEIEKYVTLGMTDLYNDINKLENILIDYKKIKEDIRVSINKNEINNCNKFLEIIYTNDITFVDCGEVNKIENKENKKYKYLIDSKYIKSDNTVNIKDTMYHSTLSYLMNGKIYKMNIEYNTMYEIAPVRIISIFK